MKRMMVKLKGKRGMTFVEVLAAVAILSLLGLMIQTGISLALHSYDTMTQDAQTQLLLSTVADVISDELRFARDVRVEAKDPADASSGEIVRYTSSTYGKNTSLAVNSDGHLCAVADGVEKNMIATGVYGTEYDRYQVVDLLVVYRKDAAVFDVSFGVEGQLGKAQAEFKIYCMNEAYE